MSELAHFPTIDPESLGQLTEGDRQRIETDARAAVLARVEQNGIHGSADIGPDPSVSATPNAVPNPAAIPMGSTPETGTSVVVHGGNHNHGAGNAVVRAPGTDVAVRGPGQELAVRGERLPVPARGGRAIEVTGVGSVPRTHEDPALSASNDAGRRGGRAIEAGVGGNAAQAPRDPNIRTFPTATYRGRLVESPDDPVAPGIPPATPGGPRTPETPTPRVEISPDMDAILRRIALARRNLDVSADGSKTHGTKEELLRRAEGDLHDLLMSLPEDQRGRYKTAANLRTEQHREAMSETPKWIDTTLQRVGGNKLMRAFGRNKKWVYAAATAAALGFAITAVATGGATVAAAAATLAVGAGKGTAIGTIFGGLMGRASARAARRQANTLQAVTERGAQELAAVGEMRDGESYAQYRARYNAAVLDASVARNTDNYEARRTATRRGAKQGAIGGAVMGAFAASGMELIHGHSAPLTGEIKPKTPAMPESAAGGTGADQAHLLAHANDLMNNAHTGFRGHNLWQSVQNNPATGTEHLSNAATQHGILNTASTMDAHGFTIHTTGGVHPNASGHFVTTPGKDIWTVHARAPKDGIWLVNTNAKGAVTQANFIPGGKALTNSQYAAVNNALNHGAKFMTPSEAAGYTVGAKTGAGVNAVVANAAGNAVGNAAANTANVSTGVVGQAVQAGVANLANVLPSIPLDAAAGVLAAAPDAAAGIREERRASREQRRAQQAVSRQAIAQAQAAENAAAALRTPATPTTPAVPVANVPGGAEQFTPDELVTAGQEFVVDYHDFLQNTPDTPAARRDLIEGLAEDYADELRAMNVNMWSALRDNLAQASGLSRNEVNALLNAGMTANQDNV